MPQVSWGPGRKQLKLHDKRNHPFSSNKNQKLTARSQTNTKLVAIAGDNLPVGSTVFEKGFNAQLENDKQLDTP